MTEEILHRIDKKLGVIIKLISSKFIEGKSQTESILTLGALGLDRHLISEIVGTPANIVSVRLSEAKKKTKSRGKKAIRQEVK